MSQIRGLSLPPRGAWIEIKRKFIFKNVIGGRSPCRERGLKYNVIQRIIGRTIVAPHAGSVVKKYVEAVKRPSQGMYRDGRWCISGVIPYLTAIGGRDAVQYSRKRDD